MSIYFAVKTNNNKTKNKAAYPVKLNESDREKTYTDIDRFV